MLRFYSKYLKLSSKCSQRRSKAFQNDFVLILILIHLGNFFSEFAKFAKISQLSLNFGKNVYVYINKGELIRKKPVRPTDVIKELSLSLIFQVEVIDGDGLLY